MLRPRHVVLFAFAVSGVSALTYEVVWVRLLGDLFGHTIYAVQVVLAIFFGGVALGSFLADHVNIGDARLLKLYAGIEVVVGAAGLLFPLLVGAVTPFYDGLAPVALETGAALAARLAVATLLLVVPTALMGATFPLGVRWYTEHDMGRRAGVAALYAANTLGGAAGAWAAAFLLMPALGVAGTLAVAAAGNFAANTTGAVAAPLLVGFALLPRLGLLGCLLAVAALTLAVALAVTVTTPLRARPWPALAAFTATVLIAALAPGDIRVWGNEGERLVDFREDPTATVAVVEYGTSTREKRLKINNTYSLGGGRGVFTEHRQGHLPMLLHPAPSRVLVLGAVSLHRPQRLLAVDLYPARSSRAVTAAHTAVPRPRPRCAGSAATQPSSPPKG